MQTNLGRIILILFIQDEQVIVEVSVHDDEMKDVTDTMEKNMLVGFCEKKHARLDELKVMEYGI